MAKTIPQLTDATTVNAGDELIIHQGGLTKRATVNELFSSQPALKWSAWRPRYSTDQQAFEGMLDALYKFDSNPRALDLEGNTVILTQPVYVSSAANRTTYANWHCIQNGTLTADSTFPATSSTTKSCSSVTGTALSMADTSGLKAGMEVTGNRVSRGTYIKSVDSPTQITINCNTILSLSSDTLTFTEYAYILNFLNKADGSLGFTDIQRMFIRDIHFNCAENASGILLPQDGIANHINNCLFNQVKDRGVIDAGDAGSGLSIESNEMTFATANIASAIGIVISGNDPKIRNNRITTCKHHMILHGGGNLIVGNHWWGGREAGCLLTAREYKSVITGNYIDNNWIELSDESAAGDSSFQLGEITITGNIFTWAAGTQTPQWIAIAPNTSGMAATVTISNASPAVVTWNSHGLANGRMIRFATTGSLPTGLLANTDYYVVNASANSFNVSDDQFGAALNTSSAGSGTHTATPRRLVNDISVSGNTFKRLISAPSMSRVETVITSGGLIDVANLVRIYFANNAFEGVTNASENPFTVTKTIPIGGESNVLTFSLSNLCVFGGHTVTPVSIAGSEVQNTVPALAYPSWWAFTGPQLANKNNMQLRFDAAYSGAFYLTASVNNERSI